LSGSTNLSPLSHPPTSMPILTMPKQKAMPSLRSTGDWLRCVPSTTS
jgi:hypothetical protein